jgi:hypothetical protein
MTDTIHGLSLFNPLCKLKKEKNMFNSYLRTVEHAAVASPINPTIGDGLPYTVPFFVLPLSARVFIHPPAPREKHGAIRRIVFSSPIDRDSFATSILRVGMRLYATQNNVVESLPYIRSKSEYEPSPARTAEQIAAAEDSLLSDFGFTDTID